MAIQKIKKKKSLKTTIPPLSKKRAKEVKRILVGNTVPLLTEGRITRVLQKYLDLAKTPEYGNCRVQQRDSATIDVYPADKKVFRKTIHAGPKGEHPMRRWLEGMKRFTETGEITSAISVPSQPTVAPSPAKPDIIKKDMNESIKKVLKRDKSLTEADIPFIRSFYSSLLKEQDEITPDNDAPLPDTVDGDEKATPEGFSPEKTKQDYEKSLNPETDKEAFDIEGLDPNISTESIKKINDWSGKLNKFAEFLNDPDAESLHKILADNDKPGSLLRGITRKASDSITRIAGEIEKLKEVLNSFVIMAPKKLRDSEQLQ